MQATSSCHGHSLETTEAGGWPRHIWNEAVECTTCARAILSMLLNGREWIARRVERVQFCDDRAVTRRVSVDFTVPNEAPCYRLSSEKRIRLIPLTVLRRKTLVNFGVADVEGRSLPLVSLRHTQALTRRILLLIAETVPGVECSEEVLAFADAIAFGNQRELTDAYSAALGAEAESDLFRLMQDEPAQRLIRRFADNFMLLVTVDDVGPGRMIVRYSYDEPLTLTYKSNRYDPAKRELSRVAHTAPLIERLRASLGHSPLAIRFPVPAAEYALSYHFEIEAPPGAVIRRASLVAGRPGADEVKRLSWDDVAGGLPVVGLHATEVPNGSVSGVQVLLRPSPRGWLFTNAFASLLTLALLWATAGSSITRDQVQVIAGALFAIGAAFIVFIVQPGEHQMVSRLVASVRYAMAALTGLLIASGLLITFPDPTTHWSPLTVCASLAIPCTALIVWAFMRARRRVSNVRISPWEQGIDIESAGETVHRDFKSLEDAHHYFGFYRSAVMVQTAEGEHLEKPWNKTIDYQLQSRLVSR
jgi:hypothetical protein